MGRRASHLYAVMIRLAWAAFNVLAPASAVLCLCAVVAWARSWRVHHLLTINTHRFTLVFEEGDGGLYWHRDSDDGYYNATQSIFVNSNEYWEPLPSYVRLRREYPHGRLLDRPEAAGRVLTRAGWVLAVTRAGWVPLRLVCASLAALPLAWLAIWMRYRRTAGRSKCKTSIGLRSRLRRWTLIASTGAAAGVTCLWLASACWHECAVGLRNGWALDFPRRECTVVVIHDSTDTDPTLWANWWPTSAADRTADPIALRLLPKFEFQPIPSHVALSLFTASSAPPQPAVVGHSLTIPYWFLFLATALYPMWRGLERSRCFAISRQRQRSGYCVGCGYDLRASSGRCPECGKQMQPVP